MTQHIATIRRSRGKGPRGRAARQRKAQLGARVVQTAAESAAQATKRLLA